jgi:hypothetical protein
MALAKIKEESKSAVVAFGNSGLPLGQRDDIDQLARIALESQNPNLLFLFESLPTLEELKKAEFEGGLKKIGAVIKTAAEKKAETN